jgi:hypothetical protein
MDNNVGHVVWKVLVRAGVVLMLCIIMAFGIHMNRLQYTSIMHGLSRLVAREVTVKGIYAHSIYQPYLNYL